MFEGLSHLGFIGPGGPEFLLVMLVLLMMFGAKDAPRILRKLNEIISQIRNTADGFKREVMYSDLKADPTPYSPSTDEDEEGYYHEEDDYSYNEQADEGELEETDETVESKEETPELEQTEPVNDPGDEEDHAQKT
jgi:Sec-independent protein translocase protein TatA